MKWLNSLLLLLFVQNSAHANGAIDYYIQQKLAMEQAKTQKSLNPGTGIGWDENEDEEAIYQQKIDHHNAADTGRFAQRYFLNKKFVTGDLNTAPVILMICGEATCYGSSNRSPVNAVAKRLGAVLIALEHRYYGKSQPFSQLTTENLKFLSTDQAVEDLAEFVRFAQTNLGLQGKWVAVGGSYAANLSAFFRVRYPDLVSGALASSGPVLAKADFFEYDRHVAQVAGPKCLAGIQETVKQVEQKLKTSVEAAAIKKLFEASDVKDNVDFLYVLADMAAIAIQYGYQTPFCDAIVKGMDTGNVVEAYAKAGLKLFSRFDITPVQDSFQGAESLNPDDYLDTAGMRAWMYQSCKEYGYYQIAYSNPAESARSQQITLPYHDQVCKRLFDIDVSVNTKKMNRAFYDSLFQSSVSNIFFTNGSNDPWSMLSVTTANPGPSANPGLTLMTIAGSAHCDDLGLRQSEALNIARQQFSDLAVKWVKEKRKRYHMAKERRLQRKAVELSLQ